MARISEPFFLLSERLKNKRWSKKEKTCSILEYMIMTFSRMHNLRKRLDSLRESYMIWKINDKGVGICINKIEPF